MINYFDRVKDANYALNKHSLDVYNMSDDDYFWITIDEQQFSGQGVAVLTSRDILVNRELNLFDGTVGMRSSANVYNERRNK